MSSGSSVVKQRRRGVPWSAQQRLGVESFYRMTKKDFGFVYRGLFDPACQTK